jgi:hypothetical protein
VGMIFLNLTKYKIHVNYGMTFYCMICDVRLIGGNFIFVGVVYNESMIVVLSHTNVNL